jgi:anti-anti-sigma factor
MNMKFLDQRFEAARVFNGSRRSYLCSSVFSVVPDMTSRDGDRRAAGGRIDAHSAAGLQERLNAAATNGERAVLLDCARVDCLSSAGLRALLTGSKRLAEHDGQLALCAAPPPIARSCASAVAAEDGDEQRPIVRRLVAQSHRPGEPKRHDQAEQHLTETAGRIEVALDEGPHRGTQYHGRAGAPQDGSAPPAEARLSAGRDPRRRAAARRGIAAPPGR